MYNEKLDLSDGSYSISDIQYYFKYIIKKHETFTDNPPDLIKYIKSNRYSIIFRIKTGYYLKLLMPEMVKLLGSAKSKITKDENCENVPCLEITEVVLVNSNIVNNNYSQNSRFLYLFVSDKLFGQLFDICPKNFIF